MSRSDAARKIVQTCAAVQVEQTGDDRADALRWLATCMDLIEPQLMAVYIVHGPMSEIMSVHLREEDAAAAQGDRKNHTILTWEIE
jgi:hypothetical protein